MFVTILSIVLVALTPVSTMSPRAPAPQGGVPSGARAPLGGGGPDAYGYKYLDSDTTCSGAPTYKWVSIKGVGTKITGLQDDNNVGPFPIGFNFPYYWYRVNSVIVGSNGYITFGDKSPNSMGFRPVPSTNKPNNQLAPFLSDLDCDSSASPHGSVWYWTNAATDSFIVEYDSIAFWTTGGNNTFQIILTKADSSITFQYKEQSGVPNLGWSDTCNQTGIENVSGAIGLNYLSGTTPASNAIHDSLAVRFFPPESTTLQVHDVGVRNAMNDRSGGLFTINGRPLSFWAAVKNYGNQAEAGYQVYFKVLRTTTTLFSDSTWASPSNPGEVESLALTNVWRPSTNGTYTIKVFTKLAGDMLAANDTVNVELHVVTLPGMLTYDGGTSNNPVSWGASGGMGARFVPPVYPCSINAIRQYLSVSSSSSRSVLLAVYDDDGPGGGPGTVLFSESVSVLAATWDTVTPPSPVVITDGAFFVGAVTSADSVSFGTDNSLPASYQEWENVGGLWSPCRFAEQQDACANAMISGPVGVSEWSQPPPGPAPARVDVNPNPFGGMTTIRLLNATGLEKAIELYDATGSVVRTLRLSRGQATLDGRQLADGIYFARVAGTEAPVAKVIVTH